MPNAVLTEPLCERNYNLPCPSTWTYVGGNICEPSTLYAGPCGNEDVTDFSPIEKANLASSCNTHWDCVTACPAHTDWSAPCPYGWTVNQDKSCSASHIYRKKGPCIPDETFQDHTPVMREEWAYRCDVHWPCQGAAVVSYIEGNSLPGLYHQVVTGPPPPFHEWDTPAAYTEHVLGTGSRTQTGHIGATPRWTTWGPVLASWTSLASTATERKCIKWRLYAMWSSSRASPLAGRRRSLGRRA